MYAWARTIGRWFPWKTTLVVLGLAGAAVGGGYLWWDYHWRGASQALYDDEPDLAQEHIDWCLWLWPRSVAAHLLAARIDRVLGNFRSAEEHLKRCKELQGGSSEATQFEWLFLRARAGDLKEVAPDLWACVKAKHPMTPRILEVLAAEYTRTRHWELAVNCIRLWHKAEPDNPQPLIVGGQLSLQMDLMGPAMEMYRKAVELAPQRWRARQALTEMLLMSNDITEARAHLAILLQEQPNSPEVQATRGRMLMIEANLEEARTVLDAALAKKPNMLMALLNRANLELLLDRPKEAEVWFRKVLVVEPTHHEAHHNLYVALKRQPGRQQEAKEQLRKADEIKGLLKRIQELRGTGKEEAYARSADTAAELGELYLKLSNENEGLFWLEQALEASPLHPRANRLMADYYKGKNDPGREQLYRQKAAP